MAQLPVMLGPLAMAEALTLLETTAIRDRQKNAVSVAPILGLQRKVRMRKGFGRHCPYE